MAETTTKKKKKKKKKKRPSKPTASIAELQAGPRSTA
jgi:hypothetical protein